MAVSVLERTTGATGLPSGEATGNVVQRNAFCPFQ